MIRGPEQHKLHPAKGRSSPIQVLWYAPWPTMCRGMLSVVVCKYHDMANIAIKYHDMANLAIKYHDMANLVIKYRAMVHVPKKFSKSCLHIES